VRCETKDGCAQASGGALQEVAMRTGRMGCADQCAYNPSLSAAAFAGCDHVGRDVCWRVSGARDSAE